MTCETDRHTFTPEELSAGFRSTLRSERVVGAPTPEP